MALAKTSRPPEGTTILDVKTARGSAPSVAGGSRRPFPVTASYVFVPGCEVNALTSYGALLTFFDYPGTEGATTAEQAPDVFLPEASDSDWSVLLRHCRRLAVRRRRGRHHRRVTSRSLYLVVDGTLEVRPQGPGRLTGRSRPVITVGAGSVLGEMSFFDSGQRSALVRATTPGSWLSYGWMTLMPWPKKTPGWVFRSCSTSGVSWLSACDGPRALDRGPGVDEVFALRISRPFSHRGLELRAGPWCPVVPRRGHP